jgi:hypothetical protein
MDADYASVRQLRDDGKTLQEIADMFGVSAAWIGQVLKPRERCAIHGIGYTTRCYRCAWQDELDNAVRRAKRDGMMAEIRKLSMRDRTHGTVVRRAMLVKKLHDDYSLSFVNIGKLLKRHHTSVLKLYHKN